MTRRKKAGDQLEEAFTRNPPSTPANAPELVIEVQEEPVQFQEFEPDHSDRVQEDDPYDVLRRQFDDLKAQKEASDARAREFEQKAKHNASEYQVATKAAIDNAITLTKTDMDAAKREITRAAAEGDWDAFGTAQADLVRAQQNLMRLEDGKANFEASGGQASSGADGDPAEAEIRKYTPRTQTWLREHKSDLWGNPKRVARAQAGHLLAESDGLEADTELYWEFMDKHMGYTVTKQEGAPAPATEKARSAPIPAAPVSRSEFGQAPRNTGVRLSKEQKDTALKMWPDKSPSEALALYARGIQELDANGKAGKGLMWNKDKYGGNYGSI